MNRIVLSEKLRELQDLAQAARQIIEGQELQLELAPGEWEHPDLPEFEVALIETTYGRDGEILDTEVEESTRDLYSIFDLVREAEEFSCSPPKGEGWWSTTHTCMYTGCVTEHSIHVRGLTDEEWKDLHDLADFYGCYY